MAETQPILSRPRLQREECGIRDESGDTVPVIRLAIDWADAEMFDNATQGERLAWLCLLCYMHSFERRQPRFNLKAFAKRYRLGIRAVESILRKAEDAGHLRWNLGRAVVVHWNEWIRLKRRWRRTPGNWNETRETVLDRDGRMCRYCGQPADTVDHVVPHSRRGADEESNLVAACRSCNSRKNAKTPEEAGMPLRNPSNGVGPANGR